MDNNLSTNDTMRVRDKYGEGLIAKVSIDVTLTVKAATLIIISGRGSAISSANEGKSGFYL